MPFTLGQSLVNLKLYRVKGFFVSEFYLLAESPEQAEARAKKSLTFTVEECDMQEDETV